MHYNSSALYDNSETYDPLPNYTTPLPNYPTSLSHRKATLCDPYDGQAVSAELQLQLVYAVL